MLDPYTPAEKAAPSGIPAIPGLDDLSFSPGLAAHEIANQGYKTEQIAAQQKAFELQHQNEVRRATGEMQQHIAANPGMGWNDLTPEARGGIQQRYSPTIAGDLPNIFNQAQTAATGRPVGATINPGETASAKVGDTTISGILPQGQSGMTYDTLPPNEQGIVDAIAEYRMPMPSRGGFPPAQRARIISALTDKYGPESATPYNAAEFPARQAALTDFKSGPSAKNITSINTVIGHVKGLADAVDKLGNTNALPGVLNPVKNTIGGITSSDTQAKLANFNARADAVASELGKVFGGNQPAQSLIHEWRKSLSPNMAPDAQKAAIGSIMEMLGSRLDSLQDQWDKGVKNQRNIPFLTPKSREILSQMEQRGIPNANHAALDPVGAQPTTSVQTPNVNLTTPQAQEIQVDSQQQYDALPKGSKYRDSNGRIGTKR